jgi:hypothetical protein
MQDFTSYDEVDPNGHMSITPTVVTVADLGRNETARVFTDKGVDHFDGDFEHLVDVNVAATSDTGAIVHIVDMANEVKDQFDLHFDNTTDIISIQMYKPNATTMRIALKEKNSGNANQWIDTYTGADDTDFYLKIVRDDDFSTFGILFCYIYSDTERTVLIDTLSLFLHKKMDLRYLYAVNTYNDGNAAAMDMTVSNLDIGEISGIVIFRRRIEGD